MIHIIHDLDRDGWGSAALLVAQLGPESCRLHPTRNKDVRPELADLTPAAGDHIWVLDIPAPPAWEGLTVPDGLQVTWVDHHLPAWETASPPHWIKVVLPSDNKPTTTMSLLVRRGIVSVTGAMDFRRRLCSRDDDPWGRVFDGLSTMALDLPVQLAELPCLLAGAPGGGPVPAALQSAVDQARTQGDSVAATLDEARTEVDDLVAVIHLDDAHRIPLSRYSLAAGRRWPGRTTVLVHRRSLLYCGRVSGKPGLDFVEHFRGRGLDPKGHSYVCYANVPKSRIDEEIGALKQAVAAREAKP